jgi:hypothetical protein
MVVHHLFPILNEERVDMQNEAQAKQMQVEQDQEIADVLGISVLSPLEEFDVSGGAGQIEIHQGSHHVVIKLP